MSINMDSNMVKVVVLDCKKILEIQEIVKVKIEVDEHMLSYIVWAHSSKQGGSTCSSNPS